MNKQFAWVMLFIVIAVPGQMQGMAMDIKHIYTVNSERGDGVLVHFWEGTARLAIVGGGKGNRVFAKHVDKIVIEFPGNREIVLPSITVDQDLTIDVFTLEQGKYRVIVHYPESDTTEEYLI